jgi:hypothetical protein
VKAVFALLIMTLLAWALLAAFYSVKQTEYIPFVGHVQYFCSRSGVEYLYFQKAETLALHVDPQGAPIKCQSRGVHL